jgi:Fe2+ or Zn2+ uptake regulation protein
VIVELPEATLQLLAGSLEDETGFVVDTGRVAIAGCCRACAGKDV